MNRPPIRNNLCKKKVKLNTSPYAKVCEKTATTSPATAASGYFPAIMRVEQIQLAVMLPTRKRYVSPKGMSRKSCKYTFWSFHCIRIEIASSKYVTTMRKRPIADKNGLTKPLRIPRKSSILPVCSLIASSERKKRDMLVLGPSTPPPGRLQRILSRWTQIFNLFQFIY